MIATAPFLARSKTRSRVGSPRHKCSELFFLKRNACLTSDLHSCNFWCGPLPPSACDDSTHDAAPNRALIALPIRVYWLRIGGV